MSRDLILVAASLFAWGVGEGMFFYFQTIYLEQLGADPLRIGAILGAYGLAGAFAHIPAGYLADRFGRRPLMWASWIIGLAATWVMALSTHLPGFVAGLLLYGLTFFVMSPMNSYITAARGRLAVGRALTLVYGVFNLGAFFGPLLGGVLGDRLGLRPVFFISASIFVVSTALILLIRPQPVEAHPGGSQRLGFLANRRYRIYLLVVFLAVFATYSPQTLSQNFLHNQRGLSLSTIGMLTSLIGLGVAGLNFTLGALPARLGLVLAQVAVMLFALILWRSQSLPLFAVAYFLLGGFKTTRSLASAQTRSLVHSAGMGLAYGFTEMVASLANIFAPLFAGFLYSRSPELIYSAVLPLLAVSILLSAWLSPSPEPARLAETPHPNLETSHGQ